jgi:hypothetical protein
MWNRTVANGAIVSILVFGVMYAAAAPQARNSIEERVAGPDGRGVENAHVFLLSESYSQLAMDYTDGPGRYRFKNLSSGSYYVQVDPAGTDYERQMQRIDVNPLDMSGRGGAEVFHVDFALKPPKPGARAQKQI